MLSDELEYQLVKLVEALTELTKRGADILTNGVEIRRLLPSDGGYRVTPTKPKGEK